VAHSAFYKIGTSSFSRGYRGPVLALTTYHLLAPKLMMGLEMYLYLYSVPANLVTGQLFLYFYSCSGSLAVLRQTSDGGRRIITLFLRFPLISTEYIILKEREYKQEKETLGYSYIGDSPCLRPEFLIKLTLLKH
jgi:hypothetical protein